MIPHHCQFCGDVLLQPENLKPHYSCRGCARITYRNPTVGVAVIIINDLNEIVLIQRGIGPYKGQWCIPCGHLEYDEDVRDAAKREFLEETGLTVNIDTVYDVHSNWHNRDLQTVGIWFKGSVTSGNLKAGDDAMDVGYFKLNDLPPLCYPTDEHIISRILSERGLS